MFDLSRKIVIFLLIRIFTGNLQISNILLNLKQKRKIKSIFTENNFLFKNNCCFSKTILIPEYYPAGFDFVKAFDVDTD